MENKFENAEQIRKYSMKKIEEKIDNEIMPKITEHINKNPGALSMVFNKKNPRWC